MNFRKILFCLLMVFSMFFSMNKVYAYRYYDEDDLDVFSKQYKRYSEDSELFRNILKTKDKQVLEENVSYDGTIDIILFSGQSNMYGYGSFGEESSVKLDDEGFEVRFDSDYKATGVRKLSESVADSGNNDKSLLTTLIPAFVKSYYNNTGHKVFAIHDAVVGTPIDQWQKGNNNTGYYDRVYKKLKSTISYAKNNNYKISGVYLVWYQGEGDAWTFSDANVNIDWKYDTEILFEKFISDMELDVTSYLDSNSVDSTFNTFLIRIGNFFPNNSSYIDNNGSYTDDDNDNIDDFEEEIIKYNSWTKMIETQTEMANRMDNVVLVSTKSALLSQFYIDEEFNSPYFYRYKMVDGVKVSLSSSVYSQHNHLSQLGLDIVGADAGYNAAYYVREGIEPILIDYYNFDADSDSELPYYYTGYDRTSSLTEKQKLALKEKIVNFVNNGNSSGILQYEALFKYNPYEFKLVDYTKNDKLEEGSYLGLDNSSFVSTIYHYIFGLPMHFKQLINNNYYNVPISASDLLDILPVNSFNNSFKVNMFTNVLHLGSTSQTYTMYNAYQKAKKHLEDGDLIVARNSDTDFHVVIYLGTNIVDINNDGINEKVPLIAHSTIDSNFNINKLYNVGFAYLTESFLNDSSDISYKYKTIDVLRLNKNVLSKNFISNGYEVDFDSLSVDSAQYDFKPKFIKGNENTIVTKRFVNDDGSYIEHYFPDELEEINSISQDNVTEKFWSINYENDGINVDKDDKSIFFMNTKFKENLLNDIKLSRDNLEFDLDLEQSLVKINDITNNVTIDNYRLWYLDLFEKNINENNIIFKIESNKKLSEVISTNGSIELKDKDNNNIILDTNVSTGQNINVLIKDKELKYVVSVLGDATGSDGVNMDDINQIYSWIKNGNTIEEVYKLASDTTFDGKVKINDIAKIYQYLRGKIESLD